MRLPPATIQLRRAQLTLMLAVLIPTVLMTAIGIILVVLGDDIPTLVSAVLILTFCTTGITGYILGSIFVGKGASLVRIQNDFLSSVSHELNTPLTSMNLLIESLRAGRLGAEDTDKVIRLLTRETARLEQLVGRLLELTRLETGAHVFQREVVDVREIVDEAIAAFDATTVSRPTPITATVEPGLTMVGDRATLVSALVNLLTNSWKYTEDDSKQIAVTASTEGRWIVLAVSDNGVGMSRAEQRLAFTRFERGKDAIDRRTPGVGIGLAFVRAIVRGHGGRIALESRPGHGTTMRLKFKRRRKPRRVALRAPSPAREATAHLQ
jgi:two-component system phosphate regulon sensor histidine kinase PhoR